MKIWIGLSAFCLLNGCISPPTATSSSETQSTVELRRGEDDRNGDRRKDPKHGRDTVGCRWQDTTRPSSAFVVDDGTVYFGNYNDNLTDYVTGTDGTVSATGFAPSLFGSGLRLNAAAAEKAIYRFPASTLLALTTGTMEALVRAEGAPGGFMHIIDKSWLYGITSYNGRLAVHFGGGWWYSSVALPLNSWSYVAASYDGVTLKLYLNGALVASTAYTGFNGSTGYQLGIGNASDNGFDLPFLGVIDEVRLSKKARAPEEIAQIWTGINRPAGGDGEPSVRRVDGCWNVTQYNGNSGLLRINQAGSDLTGQMHWYTFVDTPLEGSISGDSVSFVMTYPTISPLLLGYYTATLDATGDRLVDGFTYSNQGHTADWDAVKTSCPAAP